MRQPSEGEARSCAACCSADVEQVETVPVEALADAWAKLGCHGNDITGDAVRGYVFADLKTRQIEVWRCAGCGLEFALPRRAWTTQHYPAERHSLGYDHQLALRELAETPPIRILDIGCADGQFLERAAAMGHDATGIDFSEEDVLSARQRGLDAHAGDIAQVRRMVSGKRRFNLITLFQVIEHLTEPDNVFSQIGECAEPDAHIMVGCPSDLRYTRVYKHPQRIDRSDFWDYPPQHLLRWTPKALDAFLRRHGWETEKIVYEPLALVGTASHMTALRGIGTSWYRTAWRRRLAILWWLARVTGSRLTRSSTGIRLFVKAKRARELEALK